MWKHVKCHLAFNVASSSSSYHLHPPFSHTLECALYDLYHFITTARMIWGGRGVGDRTFPYSLIHMPVYLAGADRGGWGGGGGGRNGATSHPL